LWLDDCFVKIEIETKLKVESLDIVAARLDELGAEFQADVIERDTYFDDADGTLLKSDRGLRLRCQKGPDSEKLILAYKGPRQKSALKARQEIEVEVADFTAAGRLLSELGYKQQIVFEKKRRLYRFGGCQVCLDELDLLGSFVEVEGPDEAAIANVLEKINLSHLPHIADSYAALMSEKLNEPKKEL